MLTKMLLSLLALAAFIFAQSQPSRSHTARSATEIPTVSLCDLMSKPNDYDGKEIRVRATYNVGFEWAYFNDTSCKGRALKSTPFRYANVVWAEFGNSVETSSRPEIYEKFRWAEGFCCPEGWRTKHTELLVTGKFSKAGSDDVGKGYGNDGRYAFQIVVDKVEEVGVTTMTSP
jgi:hypothetical protein